MSNAPVLELDHNEVLEEVPRHQVMGGIKCGFLGLVSGRASTERSEGIPGVRVPLHVRDIAAAPKDGLNDPGVATRREAQARVVGNWHVQCLPQLPTRT